MEINTNRNGCYPVSLLLCAHPFHTFSHIPFPFHTQCLTTDSLHHMILTPPQGTSCSLPCPLLLQGSRFAGRKQHIPVCLPFQLLHLPSLRSPSAPNISRDSPVMVDEPELTHRAPLAPCGPVIKTAPIPSCLAALRPTTANYLLLS